MELTTQCPRCHTQFTASVADLQRRKGFTRCVQCAYIFDGFEEVVPDSGLDTDAVTQAPRSSALTDDETGFEAVSLESFAGDPILPEAVPAVTVSERLALEEPVDDEPFVIDSFTADDKDEETHFISDVPVVVRTKEPLDDLVELDDDDPLPRVIRSDRNNFIAAGDEAEPFVPAEPEYEEQAESFHYTDKNDLALDREPPHYVDDLSLGRRTLHWAGLLSLILLLLILALQLVYVFRNQIANQLPVVRPAVEALCTKLGCEVAYERRIAQIKIVSSSLQLQGDGAAQNLYSLRVRLRNDSPYQQEWPTLIVTFTDISTAVISRIELPPERYLRPEQLTQPFGSFDELEFVLPVNSQGKRINGYKIDKYYS